MKHYLSALFALLLMVVGSSASATGEYITYLHPDLQGSPLLATDELGNVQWTEDYEPWGARQVKDTNSATVTRGSKVWYTGKEEEADIGLYYYGARWYSPEVGQFASVDPVDVKLDNPRSFNRYVYANNNPIRYLDPNGCEPAESKGFWYAWLSAPQTAASLDMVSMHFEGVGGIVLTPSQVNAITRRMMAHSIESGVADIAVKETKVISNVVAGGGASAENIGVQDMKRIQNAANRIGSPITVVGSRAKGTAKSSSDWDYVVEANAKKRNSVSRSLPGAGSVKDGTRSNLDIFNKTVDKSEPYITVLPEKK